MAARVPPIDRERSAERIERDIETLAGRGVHALATRRSAGTRTPLSTAGRSTTSARELEALGFEVSEDPVGTLVARNRPPRRAGVRDRLALRLEPQRRQATTARWASSRRSRSAASNDEHGLDLPLQLISFLEEEGSGFGQMLLGSRIMLQRVTEEDLREKFRAIDDGRSFWEHAEAAGYEPARWRECDPRARRPHRLDRDAHRAGARAPGHGQPHRRRQRDRRLRPCRRRSSHGRGDHAGATPMDLRLDPTLRARGDGRSSSSGWHARPGRARWARSARSRSSRGSSTRSRAACASRSTSAGRWTSAYRGVADDDRRVRRAAARAARACGPSTSSARRSPATPMDERHRRRARRAPRPRPASRTCRCTPAPRTTRCASPTACRARWCSCPCRDGISHHPDEDADPADAALAAEIILRAIAIPAVATRGSAVRHPRRGALRSDGASPCGWDCSGAATWRDGAVIVTSVGALRRARARGGAGGGEVVRGRPPAVRDRRRAFVPGVSRSLIVHRDPARGRVACADRRSGRRRCCPCSLALVAPRTSRSSSNWRSRHGADRRGGDRARTRDTAGGTSASLGGALALLCAAMFAGRDNVVRWASRGRAPASARRDGRVARVARRTVLIAWFVVARRAHEPELAWRPASRRSSPPGSASGWPIRRWSRALDRGRVSASSRR